MHTYVSGAPHCFSGRAPFSVEELFLRQIQRSWRKGRRIYYRSTKGRRDIASLFAKYVFDAFAATANCCLIGLLVGAAFPTCTLWFGILCFRYAMQRTLGISWAQHLQLVVRVVLLSFLIQCVLASDVLAGWTWLLVALGIHCQSISCCRVLSAAVYACMALPPFRRGCLISVGDTSVVTLSKSEAFFFNFVILMACET